MLAQAPCGAAGTGLALAVRGRSTRLPPPAPARCRPLWPQSGWPWPRRPAHLTRPNCASWAISHCTACAAQGAGRCWALAVRQHHAVVGWLTTAAQANSAFAHRPGQHGKLAGLAHSLAAKPPNHQRPATAGAGDEKDPDCSVKCPRWRAVYPHSLLLIYELQTGASVGASAKQAA